jgi:hypothetical protein
MKTSLLCCVILSLFGCGGPAVTTTPAPAATAAPAASNAGKILIEYTALNADPAYVAAHVAWIETRPFDGMVINEYLGRNVFALDVTYAEATQKLAPVIGIFKKFTANFMKIDFEGAVPALNDDAGWARALASVTNYAQAVHDAGFKGIFFENENDGMPYWMYADQLTLAGQTQASWPLDQAVLTARARGRALMQALEAGFPGIVVIIAHGPQEGCTAWDQAESEWGSDAYLRGGFAAGMIEGAATGVAVDGGEAYDYRTAQDFGFAREWRRSTIATPSICPFMDTALAGVWPEKVNISFSTFDKERANKVTNTWTPITDTAQYQSTLTNALNAADIYVWHYTEWQDWWGTSTETQLQPWIAAIKEARK